MAKLAGKGGSAKVAGSAVGGIGDWTLDYNCEVESTMDFADNGVDAFIPTITSWKGSFEGKKDGAPISGANFGALVALVFLESQTGDPNFTQKWSGNGIIQSISANTPAKGLATYKYTFQGSGALTVPTA